MKKPITDEITTIRNDIVMDYIGRTALNPDSLLRLEGSGKGIEVYEDLLRDSEVSSALQTRKLAVVGKEWEIIPASDDPEDVKIADFVKDVFLGFGYDDTRRSLLSGIVLGYKPAEILWEYSEGDVWIKDVVGKASRRFVFGLDGNLRLLTLQNMIEGEELPERKFIVYRNVSDNGSYYGDGLGRNLYWPVWFRKNGIKFWAIFCDKFGSPTAIGKYPPGTPKEQQDKLLDAVEAIQQESGIKIPDTMTIELLEAARTGSINTYETFCAYMDKTISKVLLGHSAATESTPGRLGNEQQSVDIRKDYIKADADSLCECQNKTLIPWLVDYNFPNVKAYPKVWIRTEEEKDLKPLADRDLILVRDLRLPVTKRYFYETYGIPQPEDGDELVEMPQTQPPLFPFVNGERQPPLSPFIKGDLQNQQFGESRCPHCFAGNNSSYQRDRGLFPDQQTIDDTIESLKPADLQKQMEGVLKPIIDMIRSGLDYNKILENLAEAYPDMEDKGLDDMLTRAIFVSELWGKLNAGR
ncbi:hypothetical protein BIY37_04730 [Candidatus Brocadia sapporoensis]|uniref:Portal protein n=1 Tax=Candidatus Brocadia sapporoensis TaxID=392547 RepID=A0A1V6M155_9BACT|nr:DUF935 family protein [Candidatus Brocadia sapporoensis]OQD46129.1 hypothetical protein BIY37_04730 [Candidatus Brocadia sapporoensis]GJQ23584.1 MAG: hypothetical protein HBSAPP01_13740 [Candidatus Brocadia sapporoensis]